MSKQEVKAQNVVAVSKKRMHISLLLTFVFGVTILGSGCSAQSGKDYRQTFSVEPGTVLEIYNRHGDIDVSSWDREDIEIDAVRHSTLLAPFLKEPTIDVSTGKQFVIRTLYSSNLAENFRIQYRIRVPKGVLVTNVETSNGKIDVENVSGDIDVKTSTGGIRINKVNGFVKAVTSNGKINITEVNGLYEARNDRGDISVEVPAIRDNLTLRSDNGSITAFFSPNVAAQLEASTSNGNITYTDLPLIVNQSSKTTMTGRLGEGSGKISIATSRGSINLKKL
jgi:hypothetical protein